MDNRTNKIALVTGASSGIGAVYADRFAKRGYDLVLVARDRNRLEILAERLRQEAGVTVDILQADLTQADELAQVEERLRNDPRIRILVNNAGANAANGFLEQSPDEVTQIISLNITALTRLASAVAPKFVKTGEGAIINLSSVVGLGVCRSSGSA
jgi:short-subunit dehydrogenase